MKQPFTDAIENAELAIRKAEDRTDIFNELLEGLGVGPVVGDVLLGGIKAPAGTMKRAEQELIDEVQRRRQQQNQIQGASGKRRKRPTVMRGMMI